MKGFVLCLHPTENASDVGWRFCSDHRDRWVAMDFEESSIDFTVITAPRFVVGDISYDCKRQYFIKETDGSSSRLLVLEPFIGLVVFNTPTVCQTVLATYSSFEANRQ